MLTDNRILKLWREADPEAVVVSFARAIEAEVKAEKVVERSEEGTCYYPNNGEPVAWEYSFIHSSAIGHVNSEHGPLVTQDKSIAFGVGCIKQRPLAYYKQSQCLIKDGEIAGWWKLFNGYPTINPPKSMLKQDALDLGWRPLIFGDTTPQPCPRCDGLLAFEEREALLQAKVAELEGDLTFTANRLLARVNEVAALTEKYECNTAIMHARTAKMNEYAEQVASLTQERDEWIAHSKQTELDLLDQQSMRIDAEFKLNRANAVIEKCKEPLQEGLDEHWMKQDPRGYDAIAAIAEYQKGGE